MSPRATRVTAALLEPMLQGGGRRCKEGRKSFRQVCWRPTSVLLRSKPSRQLVTAVTSHCQSVVAGKIMTNSSIATAIRYPLSAETE